MIFLDHIILNNPSKETTSAGLGPIEQYGFILIALILIWIVAYFIKRRKIKNSKNSP